jgi:hypothetical protein
VEARAQRAGKLAGDQLEVVRFGPGSEALAPRFGVPDTDVTILIGRGQPRAVECRGEGPDEVGMTGELLPQGSGLGVPYLDRGPEHDDGDPPAPGAVATSRRSSSFSARAMRMG